MDVSIYLTVERVYSSMKAHQISNPSKISNPNKICPLISPGGDLPANLRPIGAMIFLGAML